MHVAVKDGCAAFCDDGLAEHIIATNDQIDEIVDAAVDENVHESTKIIGSQLDTAHPSCFDHDGKPVSNDAIVHSSTGLADLPPSMPVSLIDDHIEVFWTHNDQYYLGIVSETTPAGEHYNDGDVEMLNLADETWTTCNSLSANATIFTSLFSDVPDVVKEILNSFFFCKKALPISSCASISVLSGVEGI